MVEGNMTDDKIYNTRFNVIVQYLQDIERRGIVYSVSFCNIFYGITCVEHALGVSEPLPPRAWYVIVATPKYYSEVICPTLAQLHCRNHIVPSIWRIAGIRYAGKQFPPYTYNTYTVTSYFKQEHLPHPEDEEELLAFFREASGETWRK